MLTQRRFLPVLIALSGILLFTGGPVHAQNAPKIKTNKDGSQVYQFSNGTICIKQADYATEQTVDGKASITKIFSGELNTSQKIVDAISYSPSISAIHAALFDICTAYGSGTITRQQYDEERDALAKVQVAVITAQVTMAPVTPTSSSNETPKGKPASSDAGNKTSSGTAPSSTGSGSKGATKPDKPSGDAGNKAGSGTLPSSTGSGSSGATKPDKAPDGHTDSSTRPPQTQTTTGGTVSTGNPINANTELPAPKPVSAAPNAHWDGLFAQYQGDENMLAQLSEEAFARLDYPWTIKFLEQAKAVDSTKVWQRDYPLLAAAQLLGGGDREAFESTLQDMLTAMRLPHSYLHHGTTIGFVLQNLSNVRIYVDKDAQKYIDSVIVPAAIDIKKHLAA